MGHEATDGVLFWGAIAAILGNGLVVFLVSRIFRGRDSHSEEQAKQGDRQQRLITEVRHLQQSCTYRAHGEPPIAPFNTRWDE